MMRTTKSTRFVFFAVPTLLIWSIGLGGLSSTPALSAPQAGPAATAVQTARDSFVHLTSAQASAFQDAINGLAQQAAVAIVAEGVPFKSTLVKGAAPNLSAGLAVGPAVSAIAAAYDYVAQRQGNVFVLTKRYTDPHDIPCLTLAECARAAQNALQVLDTFSPHYPASIHQDNTLMQVSAFVQTLSPQQEQGMQDGTLRYGDLAPDQQDLVRTLFLYQYVQMPTQQIKVGLDDLVHAPGTDLTGSDGRGHTGVFIVLRNPPDAPTLNSFWPLNPDELMSALTPSAGSARGAQAATTGAQTLAQVVAGLRPIDGIPSSVDPSLQGKLVMTAGLSNAAPMDVLEALKAVYGLRIGVCEDGGPCQGGDEIEPPSAQIPTHLGEIGQDLWSAMPTPLMRALHLDAATASGRTPAANDPSEPEYLRFMRRFQEQTQSQLLPSTLRDAAAARVLSAILPRLKQEGPETRVPVSSLDAATRDALAVALMSNVFETLYDSYKPEANRQMGDCLDNIDQMVISGKPTVDPVTHQTTHSLFMNEVDPETKRNMTMGGMY